MSSEMPFHDFLRKFKAFGVDVDPGTKHIHMEKVIAGKRVPYTIAISHNKVDPIYVQKARRRFKLLPKDGISDESFNKA